MQMGATRDATQLSWGLSTALTKFTQLLVDLKLWLSKSAKCYSIIHSYCISLLLLSRTADIWKFNCVITILIQGENGEKQIKNLFLSLFRLKLLNYQCVNATFLNFEFSKFHGSSDQNSNKIIKYRFLLSILIYTVETICSPQIPKTDKSFYPNNTD